MQHERLNLESSWEDVKEKIKERHIDITDEDLAYEPGREEELFERLQEKMGKSKEEVKAYIESVSSNSNMAG